MDYDHLLFHPYALYSTMDIADYDKWWRETESPIEPLWDAPVHLTYSPPPPAINESDLAIYMEQLELDLAFDFTTTAAAPCVVDVDTAQMQPAPAPAPAPTTSVVDSTDQVDLINSNSKKPESDLAEQDLPVDDEFMLDDLLKYLSTEDQERAAPCVFDDPLIEPYCVDTAGQKMQAPPAAPSTMTVVNNFHHDHVPAPGETTLMLRADQVATKVPNPSAAEFQQPCQTLMPVGNGDHKRKRNPWTVEEHKLFLMGIKKYGDGEWISIARDFVKTRTHIQLASHAQKYYKRCKANASCTNTNTSTSRKKRRSIHDLTID